jgi:hypothetical protein
MAENRSSSNVGDFVEQSDLPTVLVEMRNVQPVENGLGVS